MESARSARGLRILLIDSDRERSAIVEHALAAAGHSIAGHAESTLDLYDQVAKLQPDVIIVDTESPDRDTLEHICLMSERTPRPVVLFTHDGDRRIIREAVRSGVTAYIVDGLTPARVNPIVQVAVARFEDYQAVKSERDSAQAKLAERKLVERAKGILMRKRGISEDEAYHMLRRLAMEKKLRMGELAERLIGMSELIG